MIYTYRFTFELLNLFAPSSARLHFYSVNLSTNYSHSFVALCSDAPENIANGGVDYYFPTYTANGSLGSHERGSPVNGQVPYDAKAYVFCNEGYMKTYEGLVGCVLDGDWNVPVPTCTGNHIIIVLKNTLMECHLVLTGW